MHELFFEKISKYDRPYEPVSVSFPFAEGKLRDPNLLVIREKDRILPIQTKVLARWKDDSIKWLLVHLQPDLPGNACKKLQFEILGSSPVPAMPETAVKVNKTTRGIILNTGPLSFLVSNRGFFPVSEIMLNGKRLWDKEPFSGFKMSCGERELCSAPTPVELSLEEAGPLRAVVLIRGKHLAASGKEFIDFRGRITAYAGKPYIEVEHWFLHCEDEKELQLRGLLLDFRPVCSSKKAQMALGEGYYLTGIQENDKSLEMAITADTLLYQSNEHFEDCFYGDFWVDWRKENAGLAASIHQAHQNFPKKLRTTPEGIDCWLFPDDTAPATLYQGMSKSHRLMLYFHDGNLSLEDICSRSLQFQLPDHPALPKEWYRANNPWGMDLFPDKIPDSLLVRLVQLHDSRPAGLGMFNFGDTASADYTDQGRGHGAEVWVNNEYDHAHACMLFYALTGERRMLESGIAAARHWIEVDLCHKSDDPLRSGGLIEHSAHHVTAGAIPRVTIPPGVSPSHEWVEGLLDYYHFTGRREGLEAALSVAENVMRHLKKPCMCEPGATQVRESGWALRTLVAIGMETYGERFLSHAKRVADQLIRWNKDFGEMLLAPYTSHSMPRVPFMISIAVNSLARYVLIEDDKRIKDLIIHAMDDLLENCLGPGGVMCYKELPSLRRLCPTPHTIESLAYAYRFSGNRRYLQVAARQLASMLDSGDRALSVDRRFLLKKRIEDDAVIRGWGTGQDFAMYYTSLIIFSAIASKEGILDRFEYVV